LADTNNGLTGPSIAGRQLTRQLIAFAMAGLDPAIHVFLAASNKNVDARVV